MFPWREEQNLIGPRRVFLQVSQELGTTTPSDLWWVPHGGTATWRPLCWNPGLSHLCILFIQSLFLGTAFIHTCYNCINCEVGLRGSSLQRNLPDHLHLWCLFFTSVHFRAFRILSYCPYGCSREDKGLLRAIWREKRAQLENCLPTYLHLVLQSILHHLPTPDTTTYYFSKSFSFCFSFVCLFFGGCFVCFLSCKNNS